MEKEYISRKFSKTMRQHRGVHQKVRRRKAPPPFLLILFTLLAVAAAGVLIWFLAGGGGKGTPKNKESPPPASSLSQLAPSSSAWESSVSTPPSASPAPPPEKDLTGLPVEKLGSMLRIGDSGYAYYKFGEETTNEYITAVAKAGEKLSGAAVLYHMVIPTSIDVLLPESLLEGIETSNQKKAIGYIYSSVNVMNPAVKTVPVFDALKLHSNEYIYFRTDQNWTQLGAYYAYEEFCGAKGISPVALEQFEKKEYPGFLGSLYQEEPDSGMESSPDTVEAYIPKADVSLYARQEDGAVLEDWPVILDGTDYGRENKYLIFAAGDQPYEEITNSGLNDNSSCLVVKESPGNALLPFLANHYQTVYAVDYRKYEGSITQLVRDKGIQDVILLNSIPVTSDADLVSQISEKF